MVKYTTTDGKVYEFGDFSISDLFRNSPNNCNTWSDYFANLLEEAGNHGYCSTEQLVLDSDSFRVLPTLTKPRALD